jgi:hypothetical protein
LKQQPHLPNEFGKEIAVQIITCSINNKNWS